MWRRGFWLAYLLLVTLAAVLVADMVNAALSARLSAPRPTPPPPVGPTTAPVDAKERLDYRVIVTRNIFDASPPPATPAPTTPTPQPVPQPVQATQLRLRLVGTVSGPQGQRYAIIEDLNARGMQGLYQVGDAVQQAILAEIGTDCVVLSVDGRYESLCFQYEASPPPAAARAQPAPPRPRPAPRQEASAVPRGAGIQRVDAATWRVSRELLMEQFADLGSLSTQARLQPYLVQGEVRGFRLTRLQPGSLLQRLGLQPGDVIQKVNGLSLNSPEEALVAYQQLHNEGTVRLEILRRNRPFTLTYEIR